MYCDSDGRTRTWMRTTSQSSIRYDVKRGVPLIKWIRSSYTIIFENSPSLIHVVVVTICTTRKEGLVAESFGVVVRCSGWFLFNFYRSSLVFTPAFTRRRSGRTVHSIRHCRVEYEDWIQLDAKCGLDERTIPSWTITSAIHCPPHNQMDTKYPAIE